MSSGTNSDAHLDQDILQCRQELFRVYQEQARQPDQPVMDQPVQELEDLDNPHARKADHSPTIEQLQQQIQEKNDQQAKILKDKNQQIDSLLHQYALSQEQIQKLQMLNETLETKTSDLEAEFSSARLQIDQFQSRHNELSQVKEELNQFQTEFSQVQAHSKTLENTLSQQSLQLQEADSDQKALKEEIRKLREQYNLKCQQCEQLLEGNQELKDQTNITESKNANTDSIEQSPATVEQPHQSTNSAQSNSAEQFVIPQFSLADNILSEQRDKTANRRKKSDVAAPIQTDSIRRIVKKYVTDSVVKKPEATQPDMPEYKQKDQFISPPTDPQQDEIIRDIVRRDIEAFCKQHGNVTIEFPNGLFEK